MDENIIRSTALFFYLNFFDTKLAFAASQRSLSTWRDLGTNRRSDLIPIAQKTLKHLRSLKFFGLESVPGDFELPKNFDISAWKELKKRVEWAEYDAILWSQVLRFSDEELADGFRVSPGTIRHRVGRALRELGRLL
jgi:hypothetical protein